MGKAKIEWIGENGFTWSPWVGCTKVSAGCVSCYAETLNHRFGKDNWGKGKPRHRTSAAYWRQPLKWNKEADDPKPRIFPSLCDPFDDEVPIEWLADFLDLIRRTPNLDWLLLTKRPQNWRPRMEQLVEWLEIHGEADNVLDDVANWLLKIPCSIWDNIWIGVSVEDQATADERIPALLQIPAKVRFISYEPAINSVDFSRFFSCQEKATTNAEKPIGAISWVIIGGMSGSHARPCNIEWIRSAIQQCKAVGVACFVKQDSGQFPGRQGRIPDDLWAIKEFPK